MMAICACVELHTYQFIIHVYYLPSHLHKPIIGVAHPHYPAYHRLRYPAIINLKMYSLFGKKTYNKTMVDTAVPPGEYTKYT